MIYNVWIIIMEIRLTAWILLFFREEIMMIEDKAKKDLTQFIPLPFVLTTIGAYPTTLLIYF